MEKKFTKVNRIICHSENNDLVLILDDNSELYKLKQGNKIRVLFTKTLKLDAPCGVSEKNCFADDYDYDYVMHGRFLS